MTESISPLRTEIDREKSGNEETITTETNESRGFGSVTDGFQRDASAAKGACLNQRGGDTLPAKARAFHAKIAALRKLPGNCGRCGKPNANGFRQCERCRTYQSKYKQTLRQEPVTVDAKVLRVLTARTASLEMELARMQVNGRAAYKKGYRTGAAHERKVRYEELPSLSRQEAATINHAYATP